MQSDKPRDNKSKLNSQSFFRSLLIFGFIMLSERPSPGFVVNGKGVLDPAEARSSPSHIIATKGSSIWLHWNYTYIGDGPQGLISLTFKEQAIGFNSTLVPTIQVLAKRIGQNGALTLEPSIPVPFNGKVRVISSNSTLVIDNLQYNDSAYQFSSNVTVNPIIYVFELKPVVSITVNGIPDIIARPPSVLTVNEGSHLQLKVEMDGNPQPSADFRWSHLNSSSATNVPSVQLYPFVYSSTYTLRNIRASYCGRHLQTTLRNSIGSSSITTSTNVTVLLKLDMEFGLKAEKIAASKCVQVKWSKVDSGACYIRYKVVLKSASGCDEYSNSGFNIGEMTMCSFKAFSNVTKAQLTVNFKATFTAVTVNVTESAVSTVASTKSDSGSSVGVIVGASVGSFIFLAILFIIFWFLTSPKRSSRNLDARPVR